MEKEIKICIAIVLALFSCLIAESLHERIQFKEQDEAQHPVPKISSQEIIFGFNANKEKFEIVKNYMLTKNEDFSLDSNNYLEKVQDETVKAALDVIFTQLKYDDIDSYNFKIFFECNGNYCETGVIYLKNPNNNSYPDELKLQDNWYELYNAHGAEFIIERLSFTALIAVFVISVPVVYLILTLIDTIILKIKNARKAKAKSNE